MFGSLPLPMLAASFFEQFFEVFTPRRACMNYEADVVWLHAISDGLIAVAYFSIPVALVYFVRRRKDLQFSWMYVLFAVFILACGTTHAFGVVDLWQPIYRLDGVVKLITAIASVAAAILLWSLIPKALVLPSPAQLRQANQELERQIAERQRAEEALRRITEDLEERVRQRTAELEQSNNMLRAEIAARKEIETQRKELLARERAARSDAERASRMKDEFLATLSHELRTPLNAILGWAQLLRMRPADPEELTQGLETIERNARAQTQLIEDLLDMSRITAGKLRLEIQPVRMEEIIDAALDTVHPAADAKGIRLLKQVPPDVAPISGDPHRLQQIIWNLLTNAIKFTPSGGQVTVGLESSESRIELSVSDTGPGIDPAFLPFLFERFRQADSSTTRKHGGLGLGLAIVRHLVEMHGGTIEVGSPGPGQGATFLVRLPRGPLAPEPPVAKRAQPEVPRGAAVSLRGLKVLVVDDEPDARELIQRMLQANGAHALVAASAGEALQMLREEHPDVLISDIGMPLQDGYELIQKVRQLPAEEGGTIPAIALTAFARAEDRRRTLLCGYQMHVPKPVESAELVTVVASVLGRLGSSPAGLGPMPSGACDEPPVP